MRRVPAIAAMTIKAAVRSQTLLALILLVFAGIAFFPLVLKSDGTAAGWIQLYLSYSLGWTVILLSIAAAWAGAGAVSMEIGGRQIQLLVTKPVSGFHLWFGKWLGLLVLNGLVLSLAGGLIYGLLNWSLRPNPPAAGEAPAVKRELPVAKRELAPSQRAVNARIALLFREFKQKGLLPETIGEEAFAENVRPQLDSDRSAVEPNASRSWVFEKPLATLPPEGSVCLKFQAFASHSIVPAPVTGVWMAGPPDAPDRFRQDVGVIPRKRYTLTIPSSAIPPGQDLVVTFVNTDRHAPLTLLYPPGSVTLTVMESSFSDNYLRALLILFFRLAFLSALGLTAGCMLSFPVATFFTFSLLFMSGMERVIGLVAQKGMTIFTLPHDAPPSFWSGIGNSIVHGIFIAVYFLLQPALRHDPLDYLAGERLIGLDVVGGVFLMLIVVYCGCLALLGIALFNRRELALPS